MVARDTHRLGRAVAAVTANFVRAREAKAVNNQDRGAERIEQIQVDVSGNAGNVVAWTTVTIIFDTLFYVTTGNTQGMLERPHLSVGADQSSLSPVMLTANVMSWLLTEDADVEGCTVALGVVAPGVSAAVPFVGRVHLTFEGFGTPYDEKETTDYP